MPSDLERNLISGGLEPALAKLISNAIDNAATGRLSIGGDRSDATPVEKMRLIDSDTRRYMLTNLDHPLDNPFRERLQSKGSKYSPRNTEHPYANSQPASVSPRLETLSVKAGKYISVGSATTDGVSQSEVSLSISNKGGRHARLNPSTGQIESVPLLVEVQPQNKLEATVEEREDATVIRLRFLN